MKQIVILFLILFAAQVNAQELRVIAAAGNTVNGSTGLTLSYTVGETAIAQRASTGILLREGFWQPGRNTSVAVLEIAGVQRNIRVFPNPTSGQFTLDLGEGFPIGLRCTLFNVLGVAVESMAVASGQRSVIMGDQALKNGLYLLQLQTAEGHTVHTFRVMKI